MTILRRLNPLALALLAACGGTGSDDTRDVRSADADAGDIDRLDADTAPADPDAGEPDASDSDAADSDPRDVADADPDATGPDARDASDSDAADSDARDAADADPDAVDADPDADPDPSVAWCRTQQPERFEGGVGATIAASALVRAPGITDLSAGNDPSVALRAELGWGADGSTPDASWSWSAAAPSAGWLDPEGSGADEYVATLAAPAAGEYDLAFRFAVVTASGGSGEGAITWTYCDLNRGPGRDGSEDGYDPADASALVSLAPCSLPSPCGSRPPDDCADGDTRRRFAASPICVNDGAAAACEWPFDSVDCGATEVCAGGSCVPDALTIAHCRLQGPAAVEARVSQNFTLSGRVLVPGLTDATAGIDADARLRAQAGRGPDGSDPRTDGAWVWTDALPDAGWDGVLAGDSERDQWTATLRAPAAPVELDTAFRFSGDRGLTWTYCDLNRGPGADGSENGYAPADAGALVVTASVDPCAPNPCTATTPRSCDGATVVQVSTPGVCTPSGGAASCDYTPSVVEDCGARGWVCRDATCVSGLRGPAPGELYFSEVMPLSSVEAARGGWFEITSDTDEPVDLLGCRLVTNGASVTLTASTVVPADGRVLGARVRDPAATELDPQLLFAGFAPGAEGGFLYLECSGELVDVVTWTAEQVTSDVAIQLDSGRPGADENDWRVNWCAAASTYGTAGRLGSPGAANAACPDVAHPIGWCRLQWPISLELEEGNVATTYGRVYVPGLSDRSDGVDADPLVIAQAGVGPDGSTPGPSWVWSDARANAGWRGSTGGEPNNDEYLATIVAPPATAPRYDLAFRFSGDGGRTWTYCDRNMGVGADGSENGYSASAAGDLRVTPRVDPCVPNPCVTPGASTCDGQLATRVVQAGVCSNPPLECAYTPITEDCDARGGTCESGVCLLAPPVAVGWCRLQWPPTLDVAAGAPVSVYGRVWAAGVTDISRGVDRYPALVAELGWGPTATSPVDAPLAWTWSPAEANTAFDAAAAGEPANDEYRATVPAPAPGTYAYAFRFSGDNGRSWIYCDAGAPGSADGYRQADAGRMTTR